MSQAIKFWANKLQKESPEKLTEFWAYIKAAGANSDICGESAYWWALKN